VRVRRLTVGDLDTNCWLVDDGQGGPTLVVDPGGESQVILEALGSEPVGGIILTHGHFDHIGAVRSLKSKFDVPLMIHAADAGSITTATGSGGALFGFDVSSPQADRLLVDGETVESGGVVLTVMHTPGHTPGSICLVGDGHLLSGDTLFAGSIGRTDFAGGDMTTMRRSIGRLASLGDEIRVHPGHGPETSIGRERRVNPFFPRA